MARPRWNHNIHYHRLVLDAIPGGATTALDVGTGDGLLACDLRDRVPEVTAIDVDGDVVANARREWRGIGFHVGAVMTYDFGRRFDVVASIAVLHHLPDLPRALARLADLTAPGGTLVIIGLARSAGPVDIVMDLAGTVQHRWLSRRRGHWEHRAPTVWPPPHTYAEVRQIASRQLPGVRWQRLPLFRYALVWHKK